MSLKTLAAALFGRSKKLSNVERRILECVREELAECAKPLWDAQIAAINKVQRLPHGVEADFYRMKDGRPTFDTAISFPNKTEELHIATVELALPGQNLLTATVWGVRGFVFSIDYQGSVIYFDEALDEREDGELRIHCTLHADLLARTPDSRGSLK